MLLVAQAKTSDIPAVTHVDNSARIQTVNKKDNPRFHAILEEFGRRTGCPVLINTSFNVRDEPIVCSPRDAFACFVHTDIDYLIMENIVISKDANPALRAKRNPDEYLKQFEFD